MALNNVTATTITLLIVLAVLLLPFTATWANTPWVLWSHTTDPSAIARGDRQTEWWSIIAVFDSRSQCQKAIAEAKAMPESKEMAEMKKRIAKTEAITKTPHRDAIRQFECYPTGLDPR